MKKEDIQGLNAKQIAKKYSLPQIPDTIVDVTIPAQQKMQASMANNILKGKENGGGGVQFEIKIPKNKRSHDSWFTNPKPLK